MTAYREKSRIFRVVTVSLLLFAGLLLLLKPVLRIVYPVKYMKIIEKYSEEYSIDKHLIMGIISAESKFDEEAISSKEAKGLMQLRSETAKWCKKKFNIVSDSDDIHNPELNINIGCRYLRYLLDKFDNNTDTALAAYNAGEGNVAKWLGLQIDSDNSSLNEVPFKETQKYVETVENRTKIYRFLYR